MISARQIEIGIEHELEHTIDRRIARQIALDHLREDPRYYEKLARAGLGGFSAAELKPPRVEFHQSREWWVASIAVDLAPAKMGERWFEGGFKFYGEAVRGLQADDFDAQRRALELAIHRMRKASINDWIARDHREGLLVALDQILEDPRTQSVLRGEGWK